MNKPRQDIAKIQDTGDKLSNYLAMLGHICSDINQGALSATLPFLIMYKDYSYTEVTMLVFAANIASALIQPLFGWIGDKHPCPWFMALGVFFAGLGMCGIGYMDSYWLILASSMLSGIGVAMFHPEGGRISNLAAGKRKADGMSIFGVGGNIGFFIGPLLAAFFMTHFGLHGTFVFVIPTTLCSAILLLFNKRFKALGSSRNENTSSKKRESWGKFGLIMGVLSMRSIVDYGLLAFIPLFLVGIMGQSEAISSGVLSVFAIVGAVATAFSGKASSKLGTIKLLILGLSFSVLFIVLFALNKTFILALLLVILISIAVNIFYPSTVALGMSFVPNHIGTASGLSYGVVICVGGIAEPFLGMAGDAIGLSAVMLILAVLSLLGVLFALVIARVTR